MTEADNAIWQADIAERQKYAELLTAIHLSVNYESDRARGVFEDDDVQGNVAARKERGAAPMADRACDTCMHLAVPQNADHAKYYRICKAVTPLPANMHVWQRAEIEGREEGACRWIPVKIVEELKRMLKDCELHAPVITGDTALASATQDEVG